VPLSIYHDLRIKIKRTIKNFYELQIVSSHKQDQTYHMALLGMPGVPQLRGADFFLFTFGELISRKTDGFV